MATVDFPSTLKACAATVQLNRLAQTFRSPFGGSPQVGDVLSERWQLSVLIPQALIAEAAEGEALAMWLAGGYNRVRVEHPIRPEIRGALWGSPTVYADVAAGASTLTLAGGFGDNMLQNASIDVDEDTNSIADGWTVYSLGTTGTVTPTFVAGRHNNAQRISASALGGTTNDRVGVAQQIDYEAIVGQDYTFSIFLRGTAGASSVIQISMREADGTPITTQVTSPVALDPTSWVRFSVTLPGATNTGQIVVRAWVQGVGGAAYIECDQAQLEPASEAGAWMRSGGSLEAGDIIGLNGQWLQVAFMADSSGTGNGRTTVTLVNRLRDDIAAGEAVELDHPTIEMSMPGQVAALSYSIGASETLPLDLEEVWG